MKNKILKEYLPLFLENISVTAEPVSAIRRGCPRRFRATSICYSDEKSYFEERDITILVEYEYGDRKDQFVLAGNSYGSQDIELDVIVAPKKDIDYKNGRCKYRLLSENGTSLVLELLY